MFYTKIRKFKSEESFYGGIGTKILSLKFKQTLDKSSSEISSESSLYLSFLFFLQQHCHNATTIIIKTANPATITSTNNQAEKVQSL